MSYDEKRSFWLGLAGIIAATSVALTIVISGFHAGHENNLKQRACIEDALAAEYTASDILVICGNSRTE